MSTLTHPAGVLTLPDVPTTTATPATTKAAAPDEQLAPVGYRWVSRRWRVLADGSRDYAAYHGKTAFSVLLPVSSKLKAAKR
jgi:hypothetical protein